MTALEYNSDPIFDLLPSFWRSYSDRAVLESIYESYLRLADADYASLFTVDDNKDLTTLRARRFQPLVYQKFDSWLSSNVKHKHLYLEYAWPLVTQGKHIVRIPNVVLGSANIVFANNAYLPTFLYTVKEDWWVADDEVVRGTTVTFDRNRLSKYFLEHKLDSSIYFTRSSDSATVDFGLLRILSFDSKEIVIQEGDAETTEFTFDTSYDLYNSDVRIEFWNITAEAQITYKNQKAEVSLPNLSGISGRGYVQLSDDSLLVTSLSPKFSVEVGSATIVGIHYYVNYDLRAKLTISETGVTVASPGSFPPGAEFIIKTGAGAMGARPNTATSKLNIPCGKSGSAVVSFLGTNINNFTVNTAVTKVGPCGSPTAVDQRIRFDRPLASTTTIKVVVQQKEEHTHKRVSVAAPVTLDPVSLGVDVPSNTEAIVFAKGRYQILGVDYVWYSETELLFTNIFNHGDVIEVWYETADDVPHSHVTDNFVLSGARETTYTTKTPIAGGQPTLVLASSILLRDTVATSVTGSTVYFKDPLAANTAYTVLYTTYGRQYKHEIPPALEPEWDYKGQLVAAESLSDGITSPTISLAANQFEIVKEHGKYYVLSDVAFQEGWWANAYIDDRALQELWGDVLGIYGESDDVFARVIGAVVAAARSSSSKATIENFGSLLFGSAMVNRPGAYGGLVYNQEGTNLRIIPAGILEDEYLLPVQACTPLNIPIQGCIAANTAVNKLVSVTDFLTAPPSWLPILAETISDSFRAVDRLDRYVTRKITSIPFSYNSISRLLVDYSVDYVQLGIAAGDVIKVNFGYEEDGFVLPPDVPMVGFATVSAVLDKHTLLIPIDIENTYLGYGEGSYGEGPYGGTVTVDGYILSYTLWARDKQRLDTGFVLDRFDPSSLNRVAKTLNAFGFGVELSWAAMTSEVAINGMKVLLDMVKPADTNVYVFTKAFEDLCSSPLAETLSYAVFAPTPVIEYIPNTFTVEDSFLGLPALITTSGVYAELYTATSLEYGPNIRSVVAREYSNYIPQDIVLTHTTVAEDSRFSEVYSVERGLENTPLKISGGVYPALSYTADSIMTPRAVKGVKLVDGAYLVVADESSTGKLVSVAQPLDYEEEQEFTINVWLDIDNDTHVNGSNYVVLAWGGITITLNHVIAGNYFPRCTTHSVTQLVSSVRAVANRTTLLTVTYAYDVAGHYVTKLYVNGVLGATSSDTVATEIADFTEPIYIGTDAALTAGSKLNSAIFVVDIRKQVLTGAEILAIFNAKALPPMGIDIAGNPLRYTNAWVTLQFHDYWPDPIVPDYSGNAFNGTLTGDYEFVYGQMMTTRPTSGDCFIITDYTLNEFGVRQPVPRFAAFSPITSAQNASFALSNGAFVGGAAALDNTLVTLSRQETTYSVPHIAYCRQSDATWSQFVPDIAIPSAAFGVDDSDLYVGFTA